jgi:hypothetical protein
MGLKMRATALSALTVGAILLGIAGPARAAGEALVEDVSAPKAGVEAMDSLSAGRTIVLGAGDRLVLNYTASCTRETIVGGVVMIGADKSKVTGGTVTRETVECHGGKAVLNPAQASTSGVMVFRGSIRRGPPAPAPAPSN